MPIRNVNNNFKQPRKRSKNALFIRVGMITITIFERRDPTRENADHFEKKLANPSSSFVEW